MSEYYRHLRALLEKAKEEKTLIAIHERPDDMESFVVGYVLAVSQTQVNVQELTPKGHLEGVMVIRMDNIQRAALEL